MEQGRLESPELEGLVSEAGHAYGYGAGTIVAIILVVLLLIWIL